MSIMNSMKGILDVVANNAISGQAGSIIWKHPSPAIISGSKLIVSESQEAIFVKGGKIVHIFDTGTYEINTQNMPFLTGLMSLPFGGKSPHSAEIWFVNKSVQMDAPWGTPSPIQVEDHKLGAVLDIRTRGSLRIKVADSRNLFTTIVGQQASFSIDDLNSKVKNIVISRIKDILAKFIKTNQISITEFSMHGIEIASYLEESLRGEFLKYGLDLDGCEITDISPLKNENYEAAMARYNRIKDREAEIELQQKEIERLGGSELDLEKRKILELGGSELHLEKAKMQELGYDYKLEKELEILKAAASNQGNPMMAGGMGLGMGVQMGSALGQQVGAMAEQTFQKTPPASQGTSCAACGHMSAASIKFCPECGTSKIKQCGECKHTIEGSLKFCPECGKKLLFCPKCLTDNPADAEACVKCQTVLVVKPTTCPDCGVDVANNVKFCPECGKKLV